MIIFTIALTLDRNSTSCRELARMQSSEMCSIFFKQDFRTVNNVVFSMFIETLLKFIGVTSESNTHIGWFFLLTRKKILKISL